MEQSHYHLFNEIQESHWWFQARNQIVASILNKHLAALPHDSRNNSGVQRCLIDVGCGTGAMLPMLARFGRVYGIDSEPEAIALCRQRGCADVFLSDETQWQDKQFDVLTFFDVIEHVDDDSGILSHYLRWLKPGGLVMITVPAFMFLWSEHDEINHHRRRYTKKQLARLVAANGLQLDQISYYNSLLFPPIALVRVLKKLAPKKARPPRSDFELSSPLANAVLKGVFASERFWLRRFSFPAGLSLLCVARKQSAA